MNIDRLISKRIAINTLTEYQYVQGWIKKLIEIDPRYKINNNSENIFKPNNSYLFIFYDKSIKIDNGRHSYDCRFDILQEFDLFKSDKINIIQDVELIEDNFYFIINNNRHTAIIQIDYSTDKLITSKLYLKPIEEFFYRYFVIKTDTITYIRLATEDEKNYLLSCEKRNSYITFYDYANHRNKQLNPVVNNIISEPIVDDLVTENTKSIDNSTTKVKYINIELIHKKTNLII